VVGRDVVVPGEEAGMDVSLGLGRLDVVRLTYATVPGMWTIE
jgi:hypothetical protein